MLDALRITQGASRAIVVDDIVDSAGDPLSVDDWTVFAQVRASPPSTVVLAEWSTDPTGTQGTASAVARTVRLEIPHAMSSAWAWRSAQLHVEITNTDTGQRERLLDVTVIVDAEVAR